MISTYSDSPIKTANGITINTSLMQTYNCNTQYKRQIDYIVVHYTGNSKDTAEANGVYFSSPGRAASAHYFVDEKNIVQSVGLKNIAWHCGSGNGVYYHSTCRNANSVGIEMCCSGNYKVSERTKRHTAHLIALLLVLMKLDVKDVDTHVLRHYDITHKSCPMQMSGYESREWDEFKELVKAIMRGDDLELVETIEIFVNGQKIPVDRILKNGTNYIKIRDVANALGYDIGNNGSIPVLTQKKK